MYSLVLMAAMTQGAAEPAWQIDRAGPAGTTFVNATAHEHYRHGCHGCHGCCGCGGGCYGGCYGGYSCCGCSGGYSCGGCYGGCYGGCSGGCYGGCYGGCSGGCYGGMSYVPGAPSGTVYTYGSSPYIYNAGYSGNVTPMPAVDSSEQGTTDRSDRGDRIDRGNRSNDRGNRNDVAPPGGTNNRDKGDGEPSNRGKNSNEKPEVRGPAPATMVVTLPADARLTVDGNPTRSTSSVRTFISPPLAPGMDFRYSLKADFLRDGKAVTVGKTVTVRAGQETRVNFENAPAQVASR